MNDKETLKGLSERDRTLITRHNSIKFDYGPSGLGRNWGEVSHYEQERANIFAETLLRANIFPTVPGTQRVSFLVSLSANSGILEEVLAEKLVGNYKVVAGDLALVKRVGNNTIPLRFDASFLPFKPNSITALLDIQGAIWHEAWDDTEEHNQRAENTLDIFSRLRTSLQESGIIVIDDKEDNDEDAVITGREIDKALKLANKTIPGFEMMQVGEGRTRFRVYKKIPITT